jgi:hypothetical protein
MRDEPLVAALRQIYPGHQLPGQIVGLPECGEREFYDVEARTTLSATVGGGPADGPGALRRPFQTRRTRRAA